MYYKIQKDISKKYSGTGPRVIVTLGLTPYSKGPGLGSLFHIMICPGYSTLKEGKNNDDVKALFKYFSNVIKIRIETHVYPPSIKIVNFMTEKKRPLQNVLNGLNHEKNQ